MACLYCGESHHSSYMCGARLNARLEIKPGTGQVVANVAHISLVVNSPPAIGVANSRHGKYADSAKRAAYMREYMRRRRAQ